MNFGAEARSFLDQDRTILFRLLAPALWSPATLDPLSLRFVDVMCRNPAFVIRFGARGNRGSISTHHRNLVCGINFLRLAR